MKFLLYCTKGKELWGDGTGETWNGIAEDEDLDLVFELNPTLTRLNGKIVAQCDCEKIETICPEFGYLDAACEGGAGYILDKACLTRQQLIDYGKGEWLSALHLCNLEVFDNPKELRYYGVKTAPQNMCYKRYPVPFDNELGGWEIDKETIIISIKPEHLKNILNGKKTIEVRKKILKCMEGLMK